MILTETVFDSNGNALGKIREDLLNGWVTFEPKAGNKHLARRKWKSVVCCQRAVLKSYTNEGPLN